MLPIFVCRFEDERKDKHANCELQTCYTSKPQNINKQHRASIRVELVKGAKGLRNTARNGCVLQSPVAAQAVIARNSALTNAHHNYARSKQQ